MRLVIAAAAALLSAAAPAAAQEVAISVRQGEVLLQVEAQGEHRARPDSMWISAGAVTTGRTAAEAMRANNELVARLIQRVRELGVEARDVQTARLSLSPRIDGEDLERIGRPPVILG